MDAVYESSGYLLIADLGNMSVHLVNGKGQILADIYSDSLGPIN